jgi:hypothetical protein
MSVTMTISGQFVRFEPGPGTPTPTPTQYCNPSAVVTYTINGATSTATSNQACFTLN